MHRSSLIFSFFNARRVSTDSEKQNDKRSKGTEGFCFEDDKETKTHKYQK